MPDNQHGLGFGDADLLNHDPHTRTPQVVKEEFLHNVGVLFVRLLDRIDPRTTEVFNGRFYWARRVVECATQIPW